MLGHDLVQATWDCFAKSVLLRKVAVTPTPKTEMRPVDFDKRLIPTLSRQAGPQADNQAIR